MKVAFVFDRSDAEDLPEGTKVVLHPLVPPGSPVVFEADQVPRVLRHHLQGDAQTFTPYGLPW